MILAVVYPSSFRANESTASSGAPKIFWRTEEISKSSGGIVAGLILDPQLLLTAAVASGRHGLDLCVGSRDSGRVVMCSCIVEMRKILSGKRDQNENCTTKVCTENPFPVMR